MTFSATMDKGHGTTGLTLDNLVLQNVKLLREMVIPEGATHSVGGGSMMIDTWTLGRPYKKDGKASETLIIEFSTTRGESLMAFNNLGLLKAPFYKKGKPQYENALSDFVHVKGPYKGDGPTDDTKCFRYILNQAVGSKYVFHRRRRQLWLSSCRSRHRLRSASHSRE